MAGSKARFHLLVALVGVACTGHGGTPGQAFAHALPIRPDDLKLPAPSLLQPAEPQHAGHGSERLHALDLQQVPTLQRQDDAEVDIDPRAVLINVSAHLDASYHAQGQDHPDSFGSVDIDADAEPMPWTSRKLLQSCDTAGCSSKVPACPRCFVRAGQKIGECRSGKNKFTCRLGGSVEKADEDKLGDEGNQEGDEGHDVNEGGEGNDGDDGDVSSKRNTLPRCPVCRVPPGKQEGECRRCNKVLKCRRKGLTEEGDVGDQDDEGDKDDKGDVGNKRNTLPRCPVCRVPPGKQNGKCRRDNKVLNCRRKRPTEEGDVGDQDDERDKGDKGDVSKKLDFVPRCPRCRLNIGRQVGECRFGNQILRCRRKRPGEEENKVNSGGGGK